MRDATPATQPSGRCRKCSADLADELPRRPSTGLCWRCEPLTVVRARGDKCERCWRHLPEVNGVPGWPGLCIRCAEAVKDWAIRRWDRIYCAALAAGKTKAEAEALASAGPTEAPAATAG